MYRGEVNLLLVAGGFIGLLLYWAGAHLQLVGALTVALFFLTATFVTSLWIVAKDRLAMRRSRRHGFRVLVQMRAGGLSRRLALTVAGLRQPGGVVSEYHVRPTAKEGAVVLRGVIRDLQMISNEAASPSVHIFAWKGMRADRVERLLRMVMRDDDKLRTWQRGAVAFGVVVRGRTVE